MEIVTAVYVIVVLWLSLYGFSALGLTVVYLRHRREQAVVGQLAEWPAVTVQIPLYNERYVVERVIDAVAALDYPPQRLQVQVLDDSTDDTTALARARVAFHQARGLDITLIHRPHRQGYKAGALQHGLGCARGEFVALFDADFVPAPDFLRRTLPAFAGQPDVGFVQARWTHLNYDESVLARALALAADAHFIVEQLGRSRSGLLVNFNGSAGVWRRACIESSGGWQADTLTEDLDLSYRAQIAGWRGVILPDVSVAAELPSQVITCKQQHFRWAKGGAQTLRKLFWPLLRSRLSWAQKSLALIHLSMYFSHVLMLVLLLTWLPVMLYSNVLHRLPLAFFSLAAVGFPLISVVAQIELYRDWPRRLIYLPLLTCLGCGLAVNNAWAVWQGLSGATGEFVRTPKARSLDRLPSTYRGQLNATVLGEIGLALFVAFLIRQAQASIGLAALPFLWLYVLGFAYVAASSLSSVPGRVWALLRTKAQARS